MRAILSTTAAWAAAKDVVVTENVRTASIMARKSRVEMVMCCRGGANELGYAKST